jgi:ABC-type transport system substrate-binding protein
LGVDTASLGSIVMDTYYNDQLSQDVMTVMQQNLADVGIQVELMPLDGASWSARYYDNKDSEMSFLGGANGADPNRAYQYFYSASPGNSYGFESSELDALLEQGRQEMDPAKRIEIYQEACRVLGQEQPWIFLWQTTRYGLVSTRINNFQFTPAAGGGSYYDQTELWEIVE